MTETDTVTLWCHEHDCYMYPDTNEESCVHDWDDDRDCAFVLLQTGWESPSGRPVRTDPHCLWHPS